MTIDPLTASAWIAEKAFACELWGHDHGFVKTLGLPVVTIFLHGHHWIPAVMLPHGETLHVYTWDHASNCHLRLNNILERLGLSMGFLSVLIQRDLRMFSTKAYCGALAMSFLQSVLLRTQLPASEAEAELFHDKFRQQFATAVQQSQITRRPWVWGVGDTQQPAPSSPVPMPELNMPSLDPVTRDQRIQLLVDHGKAMADDEIRFHIEHMINRHNARTPSIDQFIMLEPLIFTCWHSIGQTICEQWARRNTQVKDHGVQVCSAFLVDDHWFPIWMVPRANCLQFHTLFNDDVDAHAMYPTCERIAQLLGFDTCGLHVAPSELPMHSLCGAHAMIYLAHILVQAVLPETLFDLGTLHTNMRAAFVEHLYHLDEASVTVPVVWGNGLLEGECGLLPRMPIACPLVALDVPDLHLQGPVIWGTGLLKGECGLLPRMPSACPIEAPDGHDVHFHDPTIWGDELSKGECGLLPRMPPACPLATPDVQDLLFQWPASWQEVRHLLGIATSCYPSYPVECFQCQVAVPSCQDWSVEEIHFQLHRLQSDGNALVLPHIWDLGVSSLPHLPFDLLPGHPVVGIGYAQHHWFPFALVSHTNCTVMFVPATVARLLPPCAAVTICPMPEHLPGHHLCGAEAVSVLQCLLLGMPVPDSVELLESHHMTLRHEFLCSGLVIGHETFYGGGPNGSLLKDLSAELIKHGVPSTASETRASDAIKAIGSEQLIAALRHRQPWRQLKTLGNNVKFKFVLPSELSRVIQDNQGQAVGAKGKGKGSVKALLPAVELDPSKLCILDGVFQCLGRPLPQISSNQIGPVSSGVVLMSAQEAAPYLRAATKVSTEPLAIAVLHQPDVPVSTALPHLQVTVPCRCTVDNEPLIADVQLVQVGTGVVEKHVGSNLIALDSLDVVTLKVLMYKDEFQGDWDAFCKAPIKLLVNAFPPLRTCTTVGCTCECWHENETSIREPILDVWRRPVPLSHIQACAVG